MLPHQHHQVCEGANHVHPALQVVRAPRQLQQHRHHLQGGVVRAGQEVQVHALDTGIACRRQQEECHPPPEGRPTLPYLQTHKPCVPSHNTPSPLPHSAAQRTFGR